MDLFFEEQFRTKRKEERSDNEEESDEQSDEEYDRKREEEYNRVVGTTVKKQHHWVEKRGKKKYVVFDGMALQKGTIVCQLSETEPIPTASAHSFHFHNHFFTYYEVKKV